MNTSEFTKEIRVLFDNYNKKPTYGLLKTWYEELKKYDYIQMRRTVKKIIANEKYMPTLALVIESIKNLNTIELILTEDEKIEIWAKEGIRPYWLEMEGLNNERYQTRIKNLS